MGRPSKLMAASTGKISKEERRRRSAAEKALQGERDKLKPPAQKHCVFSLTKEETETRAEELTP